MYIILNTADFSANNIGTLDQWSISCSRPKGITWSGLTSAVDKGGSFTCTGTLDAANYEIVSTSVLMGGSDITSTALTLSNNVYTITIASVTSNVTINFVTKSIGSTTPTSYTFTISPTPSNAIVKINGTTRNSISVSMGTTVTYEVSATGYITQSGSKRVTADETLPIVLTQLGTVDTWYTNYAIGPCKDGTNIAKSNFAGFAYSGANDANYIGVPINAVRLRVAKAGTMTIGIVNKSDKSTIVSSQTITLANPSTSNVQEYRLSTQITLTSGQLLLFGAQGDTGLFYYKENGTATPANGECMYHHLGTSSAQLAQSSASLTIDAGFLV